LHCKGSPYEVNPRDQDTKSILAQKTSMETAADTGINVAKKPIKIHQQS